VTRAADADQDQLAQWELVARAVERTQQRVLERIEEIGVPGAWFGVLHELLAHREHSLPMSRLARELSMTSGGFTKLADRMGQEGLIDRRASAGDRRVVFAALTAEGLRLARKAERVYQVALRDYVFEMVPSGVLTKLAAGVRPLDDAAADELLEAPLMATHRDPELPERRTRFANRATS
jgi:DNA-binding MarR family transcriptional regulator